MVIVTLTTDLGTSDYYAAQVRGSLLKAIPEVQIIDISHNIEPFDIMQGAFVMKNAYRHFPEGTVHLVSVHTFHHEETATLIVNKDGQWFIGPDNGVFSLVWEEEMPREVYCLNKSDKEKPGTLPILEVYISVAKYLIEGKTIEKIAQPFKEFRRLTFGLPVISGDSIRGNVIYIDRFGNAIVNIRKDDFDYVGRERNFVIFFKRYDELTSLSKNYGSVPRGNLLCFFNSSGYLELALNQGSLKKLLNVQVRDAVQINFAG